MHLSVKVKERIIDFLRKELNPKFIYLFGSFASGKGRDDSDIDLAIYTDEIISQYKLFLAANNLAYEVKRDVQIVHLKDISTVFAAQIMGTREVLFCEDQLKMDNYNIRILKDYIKLNEERKVVLDVLERNEKVYG
ncbi:type VII toxin-antitoxin system MntA family adenylyltransferase antitoxin [Alkaliphilus serpentinus]|uniref:Nucleotidyltransferase domain-containing protein n=1 Tax=Alkaliphilus serpentinus TaxID=1482731 RepID=A0A833M8E9_9FIRM|nr:nucleotidyltransferase domain-containing protein [Alkaliphilus serpentinus]KAB3532798.1 nucleotidyltransferase domain-containing protein [Alkaliphilus serpentinus]